MGTVAARNHSHRIPNSSPHKMRCLDKFINVRHAIIDLISYAILISRSGVLGHGQIVWF